VRGIPLEALLDQFGEEAHTIHSACRAKGGATFQPDYPAQSLAVSMQPEGGVADLQRLDSVLDALALRLGVRLRRMDRIAKRVQVAVQFESEVRTWERVFVKPLDTPRAVYFALKTLLEGKVRKEVLRVQARLLELERPRRVQRTLQGSLSFADRGRSADSAIQHLRQRLGDACVVKGSDWQIPRREKVLSAWRDATGWF
jgi:nucleotidyltransferase/DNA polymerase involved in DNA repair